MAKPKREDLEFRAATDADTPAVLELMAQVMGWTKGEPFGDFFHWKHRDNPFGRSPAWVALHDGHVVGYRTFLRWTFVDDDGKKLRAVRAVDTATHPDYQGMGIFRTLTLRGVAELTLAGDGFVFNTPNDQSRPGYLKMGWSVARRLPTGILPARLRALPRIAQSRVPADLWSVHASVGAPAAEALADPSVASALLQHAPSKGVRTLRSPEYLAWRTALEPFHYRLLLVSPTDPAEGGLVFRLRRRGPALEAAVIEPLVPDPMTGARLTRRLLRSSGADYAIGLRTGRSFGLIPLPRRGPLLTTRPLATAPPAPAAWNTTLGDIELF